MMMKLSKATKETWESNKKAYSKALQHDRQDYRYNWSDIGGSSNPNMGKIILTI